MFGQLKRKPILLVEPGDSAEAAVARLVDQTGARVTDWIEFPCSLLVLLALPQHPGTGVIFLLDRAKGAWYWLYFDDAELRGYTQAEFLRLVNECHFLSLVEQPGLLRTDLAWHLTPGQIPEAV